MQITQLRKNFGLITHCATKTRPHYAITPNYNPYHIGNALDDRKDSCLLVPLSQRPGPDNFRKILGLRGRWSHLDVVSI